MSRPSSFKQETADTICERISNGESLRSICSSENMPDKRTVLKWLSEFPNFSTQYARARDEQADHYAEEIIEIADTTRDPQKAKIQVDARKWVASKLKPKKYGDKLDLTTDGEKLNVGETQTLTTLLKTAQAVMQNATTGNPAPSETSKTPEDSNKPSGS